MRKLRHAETKEHAQRQMLPCGGAGASLLCVQAIGDCALKSNLEQSKNQSNLNSGKIFRNLEIQRKIQPKKQKDLKLE